MVFFDSVFAFQRTKVVRHSNDKARTPSRGARSELESIAGKNSYCRKPATLPLRHPRRQVPQSQSRSKLFPRPHGSALSRKLMEIPAEQLGSHHVRHEVIISSNGQSGRERAGLLGCRCHVLSKVGVPESERRHLRG